MQVDGLQAGLLGAVQDMDSRMRALEAEREALAASWDERFALAQQVRAASRLLRCGCCLCCSRRWIRHGARLATA